MKLAECVPKKEGGGRRGKKKLCACPFGPKRGKKEGKGGGGKEEKVRAS